MKSFLMPTLDSLCVHAGHNPGNGEPRQLPIIQSTTFKYDSTQEMAALFNLEKSGYFYSRLQNPTCDNVAAKIARLEGGTAAMLTGSGQSATFFAVFNICGNGGHVVCSSEIYGGTFNLLANTMRKMGIETTFIPVNCPDEEFEAAFRPNTKLVFGETISNPSLSVLDIKRFASKAHSRGVPLIVDNTFPTPINCRPLEHGADIVVHSTTKYMDGHSAALGGAIVDGGTFDWSRYPDTFPELNKPDPTYHGVAYCERFGLGGAYITKAVAQLMRDLGCVQSPMNAYLTNLGLESLHLRMARHSSNGLKIAEFLSSHPKVASVRHPSLPGDPYYKLAEQYLPKGSCGVVAFEHAGGRAAAETFLNSLEFAIIATHVADARTCVLHPASATHRQMTDSQLQAAGVGVGLIRVSAGIEDPEDIIQDLRQALDKS